MTVLNGRLIFGTLPSARAMREREAGQSLTLKPPWKHLAAIRRQLFLNVDGASVTSSASTASTEHLNLTNPAPHRIGFSPHDHFRGSLSDLRLYDRALSQDEIASQASRADAAARP